MKEPRFVILSSCAGYDRAQLKPFVTSWKKNVLNADLVLFVDQITPETAVWLREEGVQVVPASFSVFKGGSEGKRYFRHRALEAATALFCAWIGLFSKPNDPRPEQVRQAMLNVNSSRFDVYLRFLRLWGGDYSGVFLVDCRDLIFQASPFPCRGLHTFGEKDTIGSSGMAERWLGWTYGRGVWRRLAEHAFLCSGTLLGDTASILLLLEHMVRECRNRQAVLGEDQAVLNYIIYHLRLPATIHPCGEGGLLTLHAMTLDKLNIIDGLLCDPAGNVIPVIHQYDRVRGLAEKLRELQNA